MAESGARWYDPHKTTIALAALVLGLVGWWGSLVWAMARSGETENIKQDGRITAVEKAVVEIGQKADRIETKLDRLLERTPK